MIANTNLSISDIELSVLNDSTGEKLVEFIRKRRGVRNRPERLFTSNNSSPRKSFPIEFQEKSKEKNDIPVEQEVNNVNPSAQSKKAQDAEQKQKSILQAVNSIRGVITKGSRSLQKSVCIKEHRRSSAAVGFNPPTTSTPMQDKKSNGNIFSPLSLIEPMDTACKATTQPPADVPQNEDNPLVAAADQTITINPICPPKSQPVTSEPSVHPALPPTNPTPAKETCLNCDKSNNVPEEELQPVPNETPNKETQSAALGRVSCPDNNKCSSHKISFPQKTSIQKEDRTPQRELDKETSLATNVKNTMDKCIVVIPIVQNITSPQKVSNENKQANPMPTPAPTAVIEKDALEKQSNRNTNENLNTLCRKERSLLISSDESADHEKQKTNNQNLITDDESREKSNRTRNVPGKRTVTSVYRHKALSLTKPSNNPSAGSIPQHILENIAQETDSCALDLRLEDKRRASDENKRKSKLERLPAYMIVDSPPSSSSSDSVECLPTDEPDIIYDNKNAACELPVIVNNVKTVNSTFAKIRAAIPAEREIKTHNEVLKESYLQSTKMLKPKKSKSNLVQSMRRKLYSCDLDNTESNTSSTSQRISQRYSSISTLQDVPHSSKINENNVLNETSKMKKTRLDHSFAIPNSVKNQVQKSLNKVESNKECEMDEQSTSQNSSNKNTTVFRKPYPVLRSCSINLERSKNLQTTLLRSQKNRKQSPPKTHANNKTKIQKRKTNQKHDSPIGIRKSGRPQKRITSNIYSEEALLVLNTQFNPWAKDLQQYLLNKGKTKGKKRKTLKGSKENVGKPKKSSSDKVDSGGHEVMPCEPGFEEEPNAANEMENPQEVTDKNKNKQNKTHRRHKIQEKTVGGKADDHVNENDVMQDHVNIAQVGDRHKDMNNQEKPKDAVRLEDVRNEKQNKLSETPLKSSVQTNKTSKKRNGERKTRKQNQDNVNDRETNSEKLSDKPMPEENVEGDQVYVEEQSQNEEHVEHVEQTAEQSMQPRISVENTRAGKQHMKQMHNHQPEESQKERIEPKEASKKRKPGRQFKAKSNKLTSEELFDNLKRATDLENSRKLLLEKSTHEEDLPRLRPRGQRKVVPLAKSSQVVKNHKNCNIAAEKQQEIETCSTNERRPISPNTERVTEEVCTEVDHSRQTMVNSNILGQNEISTEPSKQTSSKAKKRKIPTITEKKVKKFAPANNTVVAQAVDRTALVERCSLVSVEVQKKQVAVTEQTNSNSLFSWLSNLTDTSDSDKLNSTLTKIRGIPHNVTLASIDSLKFEEINGVGYAFYGNVTHKTQHFGYIKLRPNSFKKRNKTKQFELKFLSLLGELQVEIDESLITIYPGDFFSIPKGVYYKFENTSRDITVLFCIKLP